MAEFLQQTVEPALSPFGMMGKPIPFNAQEKGYKECQVMGLDRARSYEAVSAMSEALKRDEPYEAMKAGMRFLDLTGTYRLMSVLLVGAVVEATA